MKYCFYPLLCAALALAQSNATQSNATQANTTLYRTDLNGHRVAQGEYISRNGDRTELTQSINGGKSPLQRTETRVLSEGPNGRVTETFVRTYDGAGVLASTTRTVTEEQQRAGGSTIRATVYRDDANGRLQEDERRTIETQTQGATTTAAVTIAHAGLSGSFETTEKRKIVATTDGNTTRETEAVERLSYGNNQFYEAARYVREETKSAAKTTSSTAMYEPDNLGKMSLIRHETASTVKNSDGTQVTERNVYAPDVLGIARDEQGGQKLREHQTVVRRESGGTVTETTSLQRPALADPNRLDEPRVISNLVCTGKCDGPLQQQKP